MECGHLTILCAAETTPCTRSQESLRRRVVVTRGTGALSLQQGDLGAWREGDHDILFRYLFLMQINNSQTIRTNTFITYSAQYESTSYIYDLIYPHKKSVRINFTDGETKGTFLVQIEPKFDLITAILTIALNCLLRKAKDSNKQNDNKRTIYTYKPLFKFLTLTTDQTNALKQR